MPERKRCLCPGVCRSPWSPPTARLGSLLLLLPPPPPLLPPRVERGFKLEDRATRRQLEELPPTGQQRRGRFAPPTPPYLRGPRTPHPPPRAPPRARLCACVRGTVAAGEWWRGRRFGLRAAGVPRGLRARARVERGRTGLHKNTSDWKEAKTSPSLVVNPVIFLVRTLNSTSSSGALTTRLLSKVAPWSGNARRLRGDCSLRSDL